MAGVTWGKVTNREIATNRESDGEKRMIQVEISDPEDIQTAQQVTQGGEDFSPPDGSLVAILDVAQAFRLVLGVDDGIVPTVSAGEKEIYSVLSGAKLAVVLLDNIGNIISTPGPLGTVQLAGDARNASGIGDTTVVDFTSDSTFMTWITKMTAAINTLASGTILPDEIPTEITGSITTGADKVKLP